MTLWLFIKILVGCDMLRLLLLFFLVLCAPFTSQAPLVASATLESTHVIKIESLAQITDVETAQTLYLIDIDDTLMDSPFMLGSRAWRRYIRKATENDTTKNWHDLFSLFIAQHHPWKTVEPMASHFVRELQAKGHIVCCLTARERKHWYDTPVNDVDQLTFNQLESIGISLNPQLLEETYPYLAKAPEFFQGIFFADISHKGNYLLKLLKGAPPITHKVIFIDDMRHQVEAVSEALNQLGIPHQCYHYTASEVQESNFDPLIANIQLYYLWISNGYWILPNEEAKAIAAGHPERDADYYLRLLLKEATFLPIIEEVCF